MSDWAATIKYGLLALAIFVASLAIIAWSVTGIYHSLTAVFR